MSSGPKTETKPEKPKVSLDTAKKWCREARAILGIKGFGDNKRLTKASNKTHDLLTKVKELNFGSMPDSVKDKRQEFIDIAFELQRIEREYRKEQIALENAKNGVKGKFFSEDRRLTKEQWKGEQERAERALQSCKDRMNEKTEELNKINEVLERTVRAKTESNNQQEARVKDSGQIEIIKKALKALKDSRSLIKYFAKNYDPATAQEIENAFAPYVTLDWYGTTARDQKLSAVEGLNAEWKEVKAQYVEGGSTYNKWIKKVRPAITAVEEVLSVDERQALLSQFYAGQDAALQKEWDIAGQNINEAFVTLLTDRLSGVESAFKDWQEIKNTRYGKVKQDISKISDGRFINLALARIAEVVAETEKSKDYPQGIKDFSDGENKAREVVAAFEVIHQKLNEFNAAQVELQGKVDVLTGPNLTFALPLKTQFDEALTAFRAAQYVSTAAEAEKVVEKYEKTINDIKQKILDCEDNGKVALLTQAIDDSRDSTKFIEPLASRLDLAKAKLFDYRGLGPDDPANKMTAWQAVIDTAASGLAEIQKASERGAEGNFDRHKKTYEDQCAALDTIISEINLAHQIAEGDVPAAQQALVTSLKALDKILSANRWETFREATWHAAAVAEAKQLRALVTSGSLALLKEKKARADEMKANADKAYEYYLSFYDELELPDLRYRELKDSVSGLCKQLKSKTLKRALPTEHGKLLGKIMDSQAELQKDGPGEMDKTHAGWLINIRELQGEVDGLKNLFTELKSLRDSCTNLADTIRSQIGGKLCSAIETSTGKVVAPDHLPITKKLQGIVGGIAAESLEALKAVQKKLQNLQLELDFAVEDAASGNVDDMVKQAEAALEQERKRVDAELGLQAAYDLILEKLTPLVNTLKDTKVIDKDQLKKINELLIQANKKASGKPKDYGGARSLADLAYKLAVQLQRDPLASQTTSRGSSHLKELNPRWTGAINSLLGTVDKLTKSIGTSAEGDPELKGPADVTGPFTTNVREKIAAALDPTAFQQELLILSAEPPKKPEAQAKDTAKKRKIREQALAKLRRFREIVQKNPLFTGLIMESNPWSGKGGAVDGLPLLRALNDLDLNIQRAV